MNFPKMLITAVIAAFLTVTVSFAAPNILAAGDNSLSVQKEDALQSEKGEFKGKDYKQKCEEFKKDPVKALESKKEKIQQLSKEGKITKEEADAKTARIETKIKEIKEFDKLTLQQKKDKLIKDHTVSIENRVKDGKLTRDKADTKLKEYNDKIAKWDGKGYPQFHWKKCKGKFTH